MTYEFYGVFLHHIFFPNLNLALKQLVTRGKLETISIREIIHGMKVACLSVCVCSSLTLLKKNNLLLQISKCVWVIGGKKCKAGYYHPPPCQSLAQERMVCQFVLWLVRDFVVPLIQVCQQHGRGHGAICSCKCDRTHLP